MAEIIPAILESSLEKINERLREIRAEASTVQIDICDGALVPSKTWPYGSKDQQKEFEQISKEEGSLPFWEAFDFEADLMVGNPRTSAPEWVSAGVSRVVIHIESASAQDALRELQEMRNGELGVKLGIGIPSGARAEDVDPFMGLCDYIQVMGIATIGFQGQPFDRKAVELIRALRVKYPDRTIQVDGGVTREHVRELAQAGATRLIVGSAIFKSADPRAALRELRSVAEL
ncbi:MAG: hypothetical protein KGJ34_00010 [Patescibacteria group bacterium]|nr:hypothetical protein [Patescibacteria group bacterium]